MRSGPGGSRYRGITRRTGVNNDPNAQPDAKLRELNREPTTPGAREQVYCTKVGTTRPDEMYIVGAHMDGHGWGEAANDNGSGTALVMELARIFSMPDVQTERTIRFALWNNEETGLNGARAYVEQRAALQGKENPPGSGRYPEPKWLGMIQHDMMMWDHGMPRADGTWNPEQRPEADVNIEFQSTAKRADEAMKLAFFFRDANEKYATDYPAAVGPHMTNTDSDAVHGHRAGDQPARERAGHAHRRGLEPHVASADRRLRDVLGQGFSPGIERGADHAQRGGATDRRETEIDPKHYECTKAEGVPIQSRPLSIVFFFFRRLVFQIIEPRIGLRARHDSGDVRIDSGVAGRGLVAPLFGFLAANGLLLLLFSARPFAFAFSSSEWSSCGHSA